MSRLRSPAMLAAVLLIAIFANFAQAAAPARSSSSFLSSFISRQLCAWSLSKKESPTSGTCALKMPRAPGTTTYISRNTALLLMNETTFVLTGNGFDASSPSANAIILSSGAQGIVTAATTTSLTVELNKPATSTGPLKAIVRTAGGHSSGEEPFQVATLAFPEFSGLPESAHWRAVSASEHGDKLVSVAQGGAIFTSKDRGATWRASTTAPIAAGYVTVASSADGNTIIAGVNPAGKLWLSKDSGATFSAAEDDSLPDKAPWNGN